jgi:hypothetical protein
MPMSIKLIIILAFQYSVKYFTQYLFRYNKISSGLFFIFFVFLGHPCYQVFAAFYRGICHNMNFEFAEMGLDISY